MPGTIDDFMHQFGGSGTMTDQDASHYLDKFASTAPADSSFDNATMHQGAAEYLGKLPTEQFQQAAQTAYAQANPAQQQGLLGSLLGGLQSKGVGLGMLTGLLGLGSTNPQQMSAADYARVADYARTQHPDVMQQTVAQQPWLLQAMGNPIVTGVLGLIAAKLVSSFTQQPH